MGGKSLASPRRPRRVLAASASRGRGPLAGRRGSTRARVASGSHGAGPRRVAGRGRVPPAGPGSGCGRSRSVGARRRPRRWLPLSSDPPPHPHGERVAGAGRQALVAGACRGRADRERRSLPPLAVADRARGSRARSRSRGSRSRGSRAGPQTIASHCIARVPGHLLDPLTNLHPDSHQYPSNFTVENTSWKCTHAVQATYAACGPRLPARGCSPRSQAGAQVVY